MYTIYVHKEDNAMQVNVTQFRNHLQKYLEQAHKGSEILITLHGSVIARILPPINTQEQAKKELLKLRQNCKVLDVVSPVDEKWDAEK
jgi:prevent-host-death family protein